MNRLCTICARGGSKGVLNKNLRELLGLPLIAHTIIQAKESGLFSKIAVSSDSVEILEVAKKYGADFLINRPEELALDTSPKIPAIQHAALESEKLAGHRFDIYVDLDCTSPLRNRHDLEGAVKQFEISPADNLITGAKARRSPYFNLVERTVKFVNLSKHSDITRRQDAPECFDMNASIYIWRRETLLGAKGLFTDKTSIFVMPEERSIDIDSELDFKIVEMLMKENQNAVNK